MILCDVHVYTVRNFYCNFPKHVTGVLFSSIYRKIKIEFQKILLQFRNFMINLIKILLQFGSFKIHLMKIQLIIIMLRKLLENSVHFSQL